MTVLPLNPRDIPAALAMLADASAQGETLYRPVPAAAFPVRFQAAGGVCLGAYDGERLAGWAHGAVKTRFLPGETAENTPLYLTVIVVARDCRGRGVGTMLLDALEREARRVGKRSVAVSGNNPSSMDWLIPGTPGHDHNNAPGVWTDGPGYAFLLRRGYLPGAREVAMYRSLTDFRPDPAVARRVAGLAAEGVRVGVWEPGLGDRVDGMCDRVGSEYWRHVLWEEIAAWREHRPNADPALWPDGRQPAGPRPLLTATHGRDIIGFTGPVDRQQSGRGWFTGICVDPLWQGRGIATALFGLLMEAFAREGASFCSLFTGEENPARRIYERAGLREAAHFCVMRHELS